MNWGERREERLGVMLHYDGSTTDAGALAWFSHPDCKVSYNFLCWDDGNIHPIAPVYARAWHAGVCRSSDPRLPYRDANSAFYGVSIAAKPPDVVTPAQFESVYALCVSLFQREGWPRSETWRIVGHNTEAYPRGRKTDPEGPNAGRPVLSVEAIRQAVYSGG